MVRWVWGLVILLVLLLGGVLLLALLVWWLLSRRRQQAASQVIEIEAGPLPGQGLPPEAVAEAEIPVVELVPPAAERLAPEPEIDVSQAAPEASLSAVQPVAEDAGGALSAEAAADDLELIEGIGPKIAGVLQAAGVRAFSQLAEADVGRLRQILEDADPRLLRLANPATWPEQARLAAAGQWEALQAMQGGLRAGRKTS